MTQPENLPARAAWRHVGDRNGFEVVFIRPAAGGYRFEGHAVAIEREDVWAVHYEIDVDAGWVTREARVVGYSARGGQERTLELASGEWRVDGDVVPELAGCQDVDLEASALTNAFPIRRLGLKVGEEAEAPAAYVRATDLAVDRLEQSYVRLDDAGGRRRYLYSAPAFDFECELVYDEAGLVLEYPGIATRAA